MDCTQRMKNLHVHVYFFTKWIVCKGFTLFGRTFKQFLYFLHGIEIFLPCPNFCLRGLASPVEDANMGLLPLLTGSYTLC